MFPTWVKDKNDSIGHAPHAAALTATNVGTELPTRMYGLPDMTLKPATQEQDENDSWPAMTQQDETSSWRTPIQKPGFADTVKKDARAAGVFLENEARVISDDVRRGVGAAEQFVETEAASIARGARKVEQYVKAGVKKLEDEVDEQVADYNNAAF
jgi:hypothetical protein